VTGKRDLGDTLADRIIKVIEAVVDAGEPVGPRGLARSAGIETAALDGHQTLDLAIDGADEIDPDLGLIKGGGGALLREKIVIASAARFVVVAETRKKVQRLGEGFRLPVEIVRFGWPETRERVLGQLPAADLRRRDREEPYVTDEGHLLIDCDLPPTADLGSLAAALKGTVGVVEHGLFLGMADEALLGQPDGEVEVLAR